MHRHRHHRYSPPILQDTSVSRWSTGTQHLKSSDRSTFETGRSLQNDEREHRAQSRMQRLGEAVVRTGRLNAIGSHLVPATIDGRWATD